MSAHVSGRISAYIDRELVPAERAIVEAHVRECADCARAVEEMRAVDALARGHDVAAPEGYFDALPARLRGRLSPSPRGRVPQWALALAAGLVVAVLAPLALREAAAPQPSAVDDIGPTVPAATPPETPGQKPGASVAPAAPVPVASLAPPRAQAPPAVRPLARTGTEEKLTLQNRREPLRADAPSAGSARARGEAVGAMGASTRPTALPEARGYETRGAAAPAPAAHPPAEGDVADAEEEEDATPLVSDDSAPPRRAADATAAAPAKAAAPRPGTEARLRSLSSRTMRSAAEARALRDAWQSFVAEEPEGAHADDARLRALEAGAAAWRLGGLPEDRARVERDAREYLRRPDGAHKERVRALLAGLEP